jgi:hypothetical protein
MSLRPSTVSLEDFDKLAKKKESLYDDQVKSLVEKEKEMMRKLSSSDEILTLARGN